MKRPTTKPSLLDIAISVLTYLSMGFAGVVWMILSAIMQREISSFTKYHIFQSVFLSLGLYLLNILCALLVKILLFIPFVKVVTSQVVY